MLHTAPTRRKRCETKHLLVSVKRKRREAADGLLSFTVFVHFILHLFYSAWMEERSSRNAGRPGDQACFFFFSSFLCTFETVESAFPASSHRVHRSTHRLTATEPVTPTSRSDSLNVLCDEGSVSFLCEKRRFGEGVMTLNSKLSPWDRNC